MISYKLLPTWILLLVFGDYQSFVAYFAYGYNGFNGI